MFTTKKKRRKKTPISRYVYLMEKNPSVWKLIGAEFPSFTGVTRQIKIGVAVKPEERSQTVDRGIHGRIVLLCSYYVEQATKVENYLHTKYDKANFKARAKKKGSGETEFFNLTNQQISDIRNHLANKEITTTINRRLIFTILFTIIILYYLTNL